MRTVEDYINRVRTLPPAPKIISELLVLLRREDVHADRIVELVAIDPALTARALQRCNSAASGLREPIHNLVEAITRVGFDEIYRLVVAIVGQGILRSPQSGYGIAAGELWEHSAATAVAAKVLAHDLAADENLVFTAALLHDVGKIVLSSSLERTYEAIINETERHGCSFLEAEKQILGVDHCEVGGTLLARWNFPENLVSAVRHHHDPLQAHPHEALAAFVHVGDMMSHILGYGHGHAAYAVRPHAEALHCLELTMKDVDALLLAVNAAIQDASWFQLIA